MELLQKVPKGVAQTYDFSVVKAIREDLRIMLAGSNLKRFFLIDKVNLQYIGLRLKKTAVIEQFTELLQAEKKFDGRISVVPTGLEFFYKLDITVEHNARIEKKMADLSKPPEAKEPEIQPEIVEVTETIVSKIVVPVADSSSLRTLVCIKKCFGPELKFEFTVPDDFNPAESIKNLLSQTESFSDINPGFTAQNFKTSSGKLQPGRRYIARFFMVKTPVCIDECFMFHKELKSILVGAHGLALLLSLIKGYFPEGRVLSLDEENHLWVDEDGHTRVPGVRRSASMYELCLGYFINGCYKGDYLLSVVPCD